MTTTAIPTRITIDFHDSVHPSRSWIMGLDDRSPQRLELIAFEARPAATERILPTLRALPFRGPTAQPQPTSQLHPTALLADCSCPEFCERDHANE